MNKILKIILLISITTLGFGFFATPSVQATAVGLIVEWSTDGSSWEPLSGRIFNETNFLPADGVSRLIRATNNTTGTLKIGTKGTGFTICSGICFADKLKLKITDEFSNTLYENTLTNFFGQEEVQLSDVASGGRAIYNFTITFLSDSNNDYQDINVSFNLIVGALGTESISGEITPGGGGSGGGFFVPGLEISNENASGIGDSQATITWETNKGATSRVIYSSESESHSLQLDNPPNYGYVHSTEEDGSSVVDHSLLIDGLASGTTYYFRCVSRGSFAVSVEHSFTTPGTKVSEEESSEESAENLTTGGGENLALSENGSGNDSTPPVGGENFPEEIANGQTQNVTSENTEEEPAGFNKFLAAIGSFFELRNLLWLLIIVALILIFLFFWKKKKKDEETEK